MITKDRPALQTAPPLPPVVRPDRVPERPTKPRTEPAGSDLLWRIVLLLAGFGIAMLGWTLVMTLILSFLGLPLFVFGLALMQAQER